MKYLRRLSANMFIVYDNYTHKNRIYNNMEMEYKIIYTILSLFGHMNKLSHTLKLKKKKTGMKKKLTNSNDMIMCGLHIFFTLSVSFFYHFYNRHVILRTNDKYNEILYFPTVDVIRKELSSKSKFIQNKYNTKMCPQHTYDVSNLTLNKTMCTRANEQVIPKYKKVQLFISKF